MQIYIFCFFVFLKKCNSNFKLNVRVILVTTALGVLSILFGFLKNDVGVIFY